MRRARTGFADGPHLVAPDSVKTWPPTLNDQVHFSCGGDGFHCPDIQSMGDGRFKLKVAKWPSGELQGWYLSTHRNHNDLAHTHENSARPR